MRNVSVRSGGMVLLDRNVRRMRDAAEWALVLAAAVRALTAHQAGPGLGLGFGLGLVRVGV